MYAIGIFELCVNHSKIKCHSNKVKRLKCEDHQNPVTLAYSIWSIQTQRSMRRYKCHEIAIENGMCVLII